MMPGFSDAPLVAAAARGVRSWSLTTDGWLYGNYGTVWRQPVFDAVCGAVTIEAGQVTGRCLCGNLIPCRRCKLTGKCGCGVWAYWHPGLLRESGITGVIEATGRTITGPQGLRTAHAKIAGLTTDGCFPHVPWTIEYHKDAPVLCIWDTRIPLAHGMRYTRPLDLLLDMRYPGVPLYPTVAELLAAHPTTPEFHSPSPEAEPSVPGTVVQPGWMLLAQYAAGNWAAGTYKNGDVFTIGNTYGSLTITL